MVTVNRALSDDLQKVWIKLDERQDQVENDRSESMNSREGSSINRQIYLLPRTTLGPRVGHGSVWCAGQLQVVQQPPSPPAPFDVSLILTSLTT